MVFIEVSLGAAELVLAWCCGQSYLSEGEPRQTLPGHLLCARRCFAHCTLNIQLQSTKKILIFNSSAA